MSVTDEAILKIKDLILSGHLAPGDRVPRELMDRMRRAQTSEDLVAVDTRFHDAIVQATGNTVLVSVLRGLSGSTVRARIWHGIAREGATEQTHAGHEAIYQALASHDAPLAHAATLNHVAFSESWLREAVGARRTS